MDLLTITHFLNGFLMIALPILLGIFLINKFQLGWKIWLIGAAVFTISQILHIPFNIYVLNPILRNIQGASRNLAVALSVGLSAGVFEECARYGMFRWWFKDKRSWRMAVLAGAGHGGAEAIILGALVIWSFFNLVAVRNADLSKLNLSPDLLRIAQQQVQAYWNAAWYDTLFGAVERIFSIPFHIMASVLVLQVFTRRPGQQQLGWLGLAISMHAMLDGSVVFLAPRWSMYSIEAMLGGLAILDVVIIFILRQPEPLPAALPSTAISNNPPVFTPEPIEETSENLEKTRFQ